MDTYLQLYIQKPDVFRVLVAAGANVNAENKYSETVFQCVAQAISRILQNSTIARDRFLSQKLHDLVSIADLLTENGATVNEKSDTIANRFSYGYTRDKLDNINAENHNEETSLIIALKKGLVNSAKILVEAGCYLNMQNRLGETSLTISLMRGYKDFAEFLIKKGAAVDMVSPDMSPLYVPAMYGRTDVVSYLLEKGADPSSRSFRKRTALMAAVKYGHFNTVRLLIENGAYVKEPKEFGITALTYAVQKRNIPIAKLLIENGADWGELIPQMQKRGLGRLIDSIPEIHPNYALYWATRYRYYNIASEALKHGADPNLRMFSYKTSLQIATDNHLKNLVDLMLGNEQTPIHSSHAQKPLHDESSS